MSRSSATRARTAHLSIPGVLPLPPGQEIEISSAELRKMSLPELLDLMRKLGLSTADVEDRISTALTKIVANATALK
jgi:hypothetical protein